MRATVLGGNGLLGRSLVPLLAAAGHEVTVAGRSAAGPGEVTADLASGEGLDQAVAGADVVYHLASDPVRARKTDVGGTGRLLGALDGRQHLIYMSIVGVDRHPFRYYRAKRDAEKLIAGGHRRHTILRATQFHDFLAGLVRGLTRLPVALVPESFVFQPIATGDVADRLAGLVDSDPAGLLPDLAGPEVHRAGHLARTFMVASGRERPLVNLPLPGKAAAAFRAGLHTNPGAATDGLTWGGFLSRFENLSPY